MNKQIKVDHFELQKHFSYEELSNFHLRSILIIHDSSQEPIADEKKMASTAFWKPHLKLCKDGLFSYSDCEDSYEAKNIYYGIFDARASFIRNMQHSIIIKTTHTDVSHDRCCVGFNLSFDFPNPGQEIYPLSLSSVQISPGLSCKLTLKELAKSNLRFHILSLNNQSGEE